MYVTDTFFFHKLAADSSDPLFLSTGTYLLALITFSPKVAQVIFYYFLNSPQRLEHSDVKMVLLMFLTQPDIP